MAPGPDSELAPLLADLRAALGRGDDGRIAALADAVLARAPDHPQALAWLSTHARLRGDAAGALAWAERGLRAHPRAVALLFNRGAAQSAQGAWPAAEASFLAVLAEQPGFLLARFWLGTVQAQRGAHADSLRTRVRALRDAERGGLLQQAARLSPEVRGQVDAAIAAVQQGREQAIAAALRTAPRGADLSRVAAAFDRYVGRTPHASTHALQEPTFLFVPGLPDQPWWDRADFPFLAAIEDATDAIRAELLDVLADEEGLLPYVDMHDDAPAAPMWRELNRSPRWSGYHLYRHGARIEAHCRRCPRTAAALEALPLLRVRDHGPEALFSVLRPGTHIPPHTGVMNGRLTVHLPLVVPPDCGALAVGGQARPWQEGRCLVFDDSFVHEAWNRSAHTRVVLIFDLWHPGLSAAEREALAAAIAALGDFNRGHGGADPMREAD